MNFKAHLKTAILMTAVTTILLGLIYPLAVTGIAQVVFHDQANGSLLRENGEIVGSHLLGQPFGGDAYFHSRPSAAGSGYDAAASSGTNLGPTNHVLLERVRNDVQKLQADSQSKLVPIDLVTASGSGLDPDITPAAAEYQITRVARARRVTEDQISALVQQYVRGRQLGVLGEPRLNVLQLNLELDRKYPNK